MTMLLLNGNRFNVPKWRIERWMAKEDGGCFLCVGVMAAASYFFPEIANYLQMLQSAMNMYRNRPGFIIGGRF